MYDNNPVRGLQLEEHADLLSVFTISSYNFRKGAQKITLDLGRLSRDFAAKILITLPPISPFFWRLYSYSLCYMFISIILL